MRNRGVSLLALLLLSNVTNQVSIGIEYEYYNYQLNPVCRDIEPGVCCRALYDSRPYKNLQVSLVGAWFDGLESLDIAMIWAANALNWGCSGFVLDSAIGTGYDHLSIPGYPQTTTLMTGASYFRLSPRSASMAAAEGIKTLVAGGAKAACAILGTDFKGHFRRDERKSTLALPAPAQWMWPNLITLNGSNYTEFGGAGSLVYRNEEGKELDFPDLRAEVATTQGAVVDSEATYCTDGDACGGEGSGCECDSLSVDEPKQSIMFGGRRALAGFCKPTI